MGSYYAPGGGALPIPAQYYELLIGDTAVTDSNRNMNLFDNYNFGVYATNSNFTCVNNAFTNMFAVIPESLPNGGSTNAGGDAICAGVTNDLSNHNRLRVYTPHGSNYKNWFYGFNYAAFVSNYFQVIGTNNYMINKSFGTLSSPAGSGGWYVKTAKYDTLNISNDTISNVLTGIAVWASYDPAYWLSAGGGSYGEVPSQYLGLCNIQYNLIQAQPDWSATLTTQKVNIAISFQNPIIATTGLTPHLSEYIYSLNIGSNTIHDAYDGIYVNHFAAPRTFQAITGYNKIYLRQNAGKPLQYGINHTNTFNSEIYYNNATTGTLLSGATMGTDSMRAFYMASNIGDLDMGCNAETQLGRGYEFFLTNAGTNWHNNTMENNLKGVVLNGGVIGPQDNGGTTTSSNSMNDDWNGTWTARL